MAKKKSTTVTSQSVSVLYVGKADDSSDEESGPDAPETVIPHPQFFLDNTLVAIQIEKTLFNVHKYQLVKSEVFANMFKKAEGKDYKPEPEDEPELENEPEPGSSPKHPIVIKGVAASDFAALLRVLYESHFSGKQHVPETPLIIPSFRLANLFKFSELRAHLLPLAEKNLDDVDKITFAREFNVKKWLAPAHIRLCQREKPLTTEEARKLGVDSVLILWRMREQYRTSQFTTNQIYCYSCAGMTYVGSSTCGECKGTYGTGYLRQDGPGRVAQTTFTVDSSLVTAGVKKWVINDGIVEE